MNEEQYGGNSRIRPQFLTFPNDPRDYRGQEVARSEREEDYAANEKPQASGEGILVMSEYTCQG